MTLIHWMELPQWKFTVYFLGALQEGQGVPPCSLEKSTKECVRYLFNMNGHAIELTHNHGSESGAGFKVWNGNTGKDAKVTIIRRSQLTVVSATSLSIATMCTQPPRSFWPRGSISGRSQTRVA